MHRKSQQEPPPYFEAAPRRSLQPGTKYRVVREFTDYDGDVFAPGRELTYRAYNYFPHDEGLSLWFDDDEGPLVLRLGLLEEACREIDENISEYLLIVDDGKPATRK